MAAFYASALAAGGGTGTKLSPFTLTELIAYINASFAAGDIAYIKNDGTYIISPFTISKAGTISAPCHFEGYTTTEGDNGMPTIQRTGPAASIFATFSSAYWIIKNIIFDSNNLGTNVLLPTTSTYIINCELKKGGAGGSSLGMFINCKIHLNTTYGLASGTAYNTMFLNNGGYGTYADCYNCIIANNGAYGAYLSTTGGKLFNCVINNNIGGGIKLDATVVSIVNNIISNNPSGYGIYSTVSGQAYFFNNNFWNNSSDTNYPNNLFNKKTLDPQFSNATILDFRRTGNNLDVQGGGVIGLFSETLNYEVSIGIAPRQIGGAVLPVFAGITALTANATGGLRVQWTLGTGTILRYDIYIKPDNATGLFSEIYSVKYVSNTINDVLIYTEANGISTLDPTKTYYVGVKAENNLGQDINTAVLSASPVNLLSSILSGLTDIKGSGWAALDNLKNIYDKANAIPTNPLLTSDSRLNNLDATISTRATQTSVNAIPINPLLTNDSRLNYLDAAVSGVVSSVWNNATRSLTDKAGFELIAAYDAAKTAATQTSVNLIPTNPLLTNDSRLNWIDAAISSRLPTASYTSPDNSSILTIKADAQRIKEIQEGRWKIVSNQLKLYAPDNATVIKTYALFDDAGNPTMTNVYEGLPL